MDLTGTLPKTLGDLTNLRALSLRGNRLRGTIPEDIHRWVRWSMIHHPEWIKQNPNAARGHHDKAPAIDLRLRLLDLRDNELGGTLPLVMGLFPTYHHERHLRHPEYDDRPPQCKVHLGGNKPFYFSRETSAVRHAVRLDFRHMDIKEEIGTPFSLTRVSYKDLVEQHLPRTHVLLF